MTKSKEIVSGAILVALLFASNPLHADKTKNVNVANVPDVHVINAPSAPVPVEVQNPTAAPTTITVDNTPQDPIPVTVQNSEESPLEFYNKAGAFKGAATLFNCYFDVPPGKVLKIEKISGYHEGVGDQAVQLLQVRSGPTVDDIVNVIPTVTAERFGRITFVGENGGYAVDSNAWDDGTYLRDFQVQGLHPQGGGYFTDASCYVTGRLFDAP